MATIVALTADISATIVVSLILLFLVLTLGYLLRDTSLQDLFTSTSVVYADQQSRNIPVIKIQNPFIFELKHDRTSLQEVQCSVTSQCPSIIRAYWGIDLKLLQIILSLDWMLLKHQIQDGTFLEQNSCLAGDVLCKQLIINELIIFKPPIELSAGDFGPVPRQKYPLVVFILRNEVNSDLYSSNTVVGMIIIIHIKDELCNLDSYILAHYLKQASGQCSKLQPLFVADTESDINYNCVNSDSSRPAQPKCVVCLNNAITHALLPCRHMCVCESCFKLLDKCPLCRGMIQSFFTDSRMETTDESTLIPNNSNTNVVSDIRQRLQDNT